MSLQGRGPVHMTHLRMAAREAQAWLHFGNVYGLHMSDTGLIALSAPDAAALQLKSVAAASPLS